MLCPWTGQQGIYSADSRTPLEEVWSRYRLSLPGWPDQQYAPTWPGLRHDRLTVIPVPPTLDIACVVVRHSYHCRAILTPAQVSPELLTQLVAHLTPWQPQVIRYPPVLHLRSGDVLEVVEAPDRPQTIAFQHQDHLRGYAIWTQGVGVLCTMLIRLWDSDWPRPIVTWITPGVEWMPDLLTFSGSFHDSYPGHWIPVAWGHSRVLQFVRASSSPHRVNVLVEHDDRTFVTTVAPDTNKESIATALQVHSDLVQVVGVTQDIAGPICRLRDGDIISARSSQSATDPIYGWPDDDNGELGPTIVTGCALALVRDRRLLPLVITFLQAASALAARPSQPDRSRSPSRASDSSSRCSPRPSRWRPDQARPFHSVASRWFVRPVPISRVESRRPMSAGDSRRDCPGGNVTMVSALGTHVQFN